MKKVILFITLIAIFSCSRTKTIVLKTDHAEGITNETKFKINGLEIGEIESTKIDEKGNVIIIANLKSEIKNIYIIYSRPTG